MYEAWETTETHWETAHGGPHHHQHMESALRALSIFQVVTPGDVIDCRPRA
jgi:hypothetical protein